MSSEKSIIIYFSRADENYFGGSLKYIEKGNTEIVAEYIQDLTGADMFKVEPLVPYSKDYMECIEEAKIRTNNHDAPIKEEVPDISSYDVIYVGAPVYWGGMPEELITGLTTHGIPILATPALNSSSVSANTYFDVGSPSFSAARVRIPSLSMVVRAA